MDTLRLLIRRGIRRDLSSLLAIALVLASGAGIGLASLEVAARTERAYPDHLRSADVGDLVVNPSLVYIDTEQIIRSIPGVIDLASDALLSVAVNDDESNYIQVRMSLDGRYTDQDRPVVRDGRMIESGAEAFLSISAASRLGVKVGDPLRLGFYTPQYSTGEGEATPPGALGAEQVVVVGIGVFSDEVLPDELLPRLRVLVTPDVAQKYDCLLERPKPGDSRSLDELMPELLSPTCTTSYRYFSIRTEGGAAGAREVADALAQRFVEENKLLPAAMREQRLGFEVIASFSAQDAARVRQSLAPVVTSLRVFGYAALGTTIGVVFLLVVRVLRRRERDVVVWNALGLTLPTRALALAVPLAAAVSAGMVGGLGLAWLASGVGPVASARTVDPHPGHGLSGAVAVAALLGGLALAVGLAVAARRGARRQTNAETSTGRPRRVVDLLSRSPASALGIRAATRGRGAGAVLGGSVMAIAAVTATLVFSSSVVHFVDTPARYGWSYDTGVLVNAGYGLTDVDAVRTTLDRPEVQRWGIAALAGGLSINETTVPFVASGEGFDELIAEDSVVTGRLPTAPDELALGARTARDLGLTTGDEVMVSTPSGDASARISGLVALPALGPFESDRAALGTGALVSQGLYEQLLGQAADRTGKSGPELAALMGTFVAIEFADDVVAAEFMASVREQLPSWDPYRVPPEVYTEPVRPASVVDVAAMRQVPVMLAGAFAFAMAASMVAGIASGTRARRRELAVFRALGGTPRQIGASVRWHASAVVVVGLVIGLPMGVVIGRLAFAAFAHDLGVAPRPFVPLLLIVFTVIVVLAIGIAASVVPGRRAVARRDHLDATRSQRTDARAL